MSILPKLFLKKDILKHNLARVKEKCDILSIDLRPHVKTIHDSRLTELLRGQGISKISVSNIEMLEAFFRAGWNDISLALPFPFNYSNEIKPFLDQGLNLSVYIDNVDQLNELDKIQTPLNICLEIDSGQCRSGISWKYKREILELILKIKASHHSFSCIVSHFGDLYQCNDKSEIQILFADSMMKILNLKEELESELGYSIKLAIGDTPSILFSQIFEKTFEIRAGNFMLNDLMIHSKGLCEFSDIGCLIKTQVISKSERDSRFVLHCGSVHLSKEKHSFDSINYGLIAPADSNWPKRPLENTSIVDLYQEHAVVHSSSAIVSKINIGDYFWVYPVHSCLTMDAMYHKNNIELV